MIRAGEQRILAARSVEPVSRELGENEAGGPGYTASGGAGVGVGCAERVGLRVRDRFPVSQGHTLVVTRRVEPTWFEATRDEQAAVWELVERVKTQWIDTGCGPWCSAVQKMATPRSRRPA